ncbi:hypothetical protein D3C76_342900 [compost metagenome]
MSNEETEIRTPSLEELKVLEWAAIRTRRNQLLTGTDYTQAPDSPLTEAQRAEVATYRQDLRDVPESGPDPFGIVWPVRPDFLQ